MALSLFTRGTLGRDRHCRYLCNSLGSFCTNWHWLCSCEFSCTGKEESITGGARVEMLSTSLDRAAKTGNAVSSNLAWKKCERNGDLAQAPSFRLKKYREGHSLSDADRSKD
mmetsp:Transcript_16310/g.40179  ORF Transcript_16310/g.40179 Transcript_16310/m.40179 type:complete len:112 (+) Transcript_16310:231-566(+)